MGPTRSLAQSLFAILCLLGIIAIATGALLEIVRTRRGVSIITPRQLRLRIFSAVIWVIILGSLSFAVLFLWPEPGNLTRAWHFARVINGVLGLLVIALALLFYDVMQVNRERRRQEQRFNQQLAALARDEIERVQREHATPQKPEKEIQNQSDTPLS